MFVRQVAAWFGSVKRRLVPEEVSDGLMFDPRSMEYRTDVMYQNPAFGPLVTSPIVNPSYGVVRRLGR
jgi:hypothetical protein